MADLYDPDLTQWLQNSGEYIGHIRPANERSDWVLFLIDETKPFLTPAEYRSLLEELQRDLDARLRSLPE